MARKLLRAFLPVLVALAALQAPATAGAQVFTTIHNFGALPEGQFVISRLLLLGGLFYGTTLGGGAADDGTIFSLDPATGATTTLYSFHGPFVGPVDGASPFGGVVELDGVLYGTTNTGGTNNAGTIFAFDLATGIESVAYHFGAGGRPDHPRAGLVVSDGRLFGTTSAGGDGSGTVFSFDPATGTERTLATLGGSSGADPEAALTVADGLLYGTAAAGGDDGVGTLFTFDPRTDVLTVLHSFVPVEGRANPQGSVLVRGGIVYGSTRYGGVANCGFGHQGCGSVWQYDLATGTMTELYALQSEDDGLGPTGQLVLAGGTLFGTTQEGGPNRYGTVFAVDVATRVKRTLHAFGNRKLSGRSPDGLTGFGGALYGVTQTGGSKLGAGTVFELSR